MKPFSCLPPQPQAPWPAAALCPKRPRPETACWDLGGTGFLGRTSSRRCRPADIGSRCFNRVRSNPGLFKDLETLIGDRDGKLDALKGRDWDVVIDDSGYVPRQVKLSAELLKDHIRHYLFISSILYGTFPKAGSQRGRQGPRRRPTRKSKKVTNETVPPGLKAGCEQVVESIYGSARRSRRTTSPDLATAPIASRTGSAGPRAAAACAGQRAIRRSTSTCAISQRSCVIARTASGRSLQCLHAARRNTRWAS